MKPTHIALYAFAAAGIAVALLLQQKNRTEQAQRDAALRQVQAQIKEASAEQARLAAKLERQNAAPSIQYDGEVARLKEQAQTLRARTNEILQRNQARNAPKPESRQRTPAEWDELRKPGLSKIMDSRAISETLMEYLEQHQNTMPSGMADLAPYLAKAERWTGTNHFELVFHGSMDRLKGLPFGDVAVARSEPWTDQEGVEYVTYAFLDAHSQIVRTDHRKDFEAKHVFNEPEKR